VNIALVCVVIALPDFNIGNSDGFCEPCQASVSPVGVPVMASIQDSLFVPEN